MSIIFQDIDYILWTGDLPPHDVWNQTKDENLSVIKQTVDQLGQTFPNIPIFPALGNHESVPVNRYALELHFQTMRYIITLNGMISHQ